MPQLEPVVDEIRRRVNYLSFYGEFLNMRGRGVERSAFCIFHENTNTPAMGVNVQDGRWLCRNPSCGAHGDIFSFYQRVRSLTFPEAVRELAARFGIEIAADDTRGESGVVGDDIVTAHHERLIASANLLEWLETHRGLTNETVARWELGHDGDRYYIPIRDELGRCVNIRRYKPGAASHAKMISWRHGFGGARLWPFDTFSDDPQTVYLMEGEMDCLLALQMGLAAVTTTGGAGTWRDGWSPMFAGRNVVICYDVDDAGRTGALSIASRLNGTAETVRVVTLPLTEPTGADFTDYIVGHGHRLDDFMVLLGETAAFQVPTSPLPNIPRDPLDMHLSAASRAEHYDQPVRMRVLVSGKTMSPYLTPKQVTFSCSMPGAQMCSRCPVASCAGQMSTEIDYEGSGELLKFVDIHDTTRTKLLKAKAGVPHRCSYVNIDITEAGNVEELKLIPEIDRSTEDAPYVTTAAFFIGHGLQANRSYVMTGTTVPAPKTQQATHLIHTATPSQSNIDSFQLTDYIKERLELFNPAERSEAALWAKLDEIYDELEDVTRIVHRRELMLTADLTFHSALGFDFQGERPKRGWLEALVIGDSRTGKTTVVRRMIDHYGAGELCSGENTTLAGLVGGLHQIGTTWALQWGKLPLNDRRLLVVDEAASLPEDQIGRLSLIRSDGIAEIVKIHTERTNCRVRQIWISNPRSPRPLSSYSQGVIAVKELIGAPEDVARFDLVVSAASGDVDLGAINAERNSGSPSTFTADICHQRVMWAWSRKPEQVHFARGSVSRILLRATEQGVRYKYAIEIPLVEPNEQRIKIARLAVAVAALFVSTDASGEKIVVKPEHVDFAVTFLEKLYARPSLAFKEYAEMCARKFELRNLSEIEPILARGSLQALMENEQFTIRDMGELFRYDERSELRDAVSKLRNAGFLRRVGSSYYVKTPAAIDWVRQRLAPAPITGASGRFTDDELPDAPPF
jgi:hypothetical protein